MRSVTLTLLVILGTVTGSASAYDYPIDNPYMATVLGTPEPYKANLPKHFKLRTGRLPIIEGRYYPDVLWYAKELQYSYKFQRNPAPLIFVLAGTGAAHNSAKNKTLMNAFFQAGFHVVGITSPSHPQFIVAASRTGVPGHMQHDAEDVYAVMELIRNDLADKGTVTEFHLTGYSLGGTQAAFLAKLDEERGSFGFKRVLLLNPSLALYSSISKLDRFLENIPGGIDNFDRFFDKVVKQISDVYDDSHTVEFSTDLVYNAFRDDPPTDEELAALIGVAFRLSSSAMIFTADVMTDYGFIKPANLHLSPNSSADEYGQVAIRVGFTDYYHEFFWPFYEPDYPDESRQSFAKLHTLHAIRDYLSQAEHVGVVHNADDIILAAGEIDFFPQVFGDRAKIFPSGGHLGNMDQSDVMAHIVAWFQR